MAIAAGVDFGTPSARVSIADSEGGLLATALGVAPWLISEFARRTPERFRCSAVQRNAT